MKSQVVLLLALAACTGGSNDGSSASATTECVVAEAGDGFTSQAFAAQTAQFSAELDATPSIAPIDSVVGLSDGAATQFSQMAAIVRFNPSGTLDVRDGSTYRADVALAYAAGATYHFKLDVDLVAHRYSVAVRQADDSYLTIANGYAFRTEQAAVTQLDHLVTEVDSTSGSTDVCAFTLGPPPPPGTCTTTAAGAGFARAAIQTATSVLIVELAATPSADNTDAVIAVSNGSPARFDDLAVALRFAPSGDLDARDGDTYRAITELAYVAGTPYQLRLVIDLSSHTYSAFAQAPSQPAIEVAHDFAFRPTQATVTQLDSLDSIVDTSDGATLQLCNLTAGAADQILYVRDGRPSLALLPNDEVIESDGTRTMHLDARGSLVAQAAIAGEVAVDGAGDIAVASAASGTLHVTSYTPAFAARWQITYPVGADETVVGAGCDAAGDVMVATSTGGQLAYVYQFGPDGAAHWGIHIGQTAIAATAVALMRDGFAFAYPQPGGIVIQHQRSDGQPDWFRTWSGDFTVLAMASDSGGDLVFTGKYYEDIDFAPGVVTYHSGGEVATNTYVALLGADATTVFAINAGDSYVRGVATNGDEVAVSGEHDTGVRIPHLDRFDRTGQLQGDLEDPGLGDFGVADRTWLAASGRAYWNRTSEFPRYQEWPYYVALPPQ